MDISVYDLDDDTDRLVLADALADAGREREAAECRCGPVLFHEGTIYAVRTLGEFCEATINVVLTAQTVLECNTTDYVVGHMDMETPDGLYDLRGTIEDDGKAWRWTGEGNARDWRGTSYRYLVARSDHKRWYELVADYHNGY